MKTMKWTLLLAFFAIWACQEDQLSQEEVWQDSSSPSPRVERLRTIKRVDNAPATRAVSVKDKLWQPGDTIRIKFQNADEFPGMSDKVIQYAAIWLQYAYLHFEYVDKEEEADVKIGFNMDDRWLSWSTIGTDCKSIDQDSVSANFVWLENDDEETIQGEVLRTFGHILGLGFEHQSPASPITLNEIKTIDYYIDNFNLTDSTIINDILPYYNSDQTNYTEFDDMSIMTLELPGRQTQERPYYNLYFNYTLSPTDISFVRDSLYPLPIEPEPEDGSIFRFSTKAQNLSMLLLIDDDLTITWGDGLSTTYGKSYRTERVTISFDDATTVKKIKFFGSDTALISIQFDTDILSIDATGSKKLKELYCREHGLNQLEISHNKRLETLFCDRNNLTTLTLNNPKLKTLQCELNQINALDVAKCPELIWIVCNNNQLKTLDVTRNDSLFNLICRNNNLDILDLSSNKKLGHLDCENNNLSYLDLTNNPDLLVINTASNKINSLVFSNNNSIHTIHSPNCLLETFDIRPLKKLHSLTLFNNPLNREALLDIANNIVDNTTSSGGVFHFSPVDDAIKTIFNSKNWSVLGPTDMYIYRNYASFFNNETLPLSTEILKEKYLEYFVR